MAPSPLRSATGGLFTIGGSLRTTAPTAGDAAVLQTFTITNTEGAATSPGLVRVPIHFKDGDMPSGSIPQVEIQGGAEITDIQFSSRATWNSGALKRCVCYFRDSTFTAAQTRTYDVSAQTGSFNDTPAFTTTDVSNEADLKVLFSNVRTADELQEGQFANFAVVSGDATVTVSYTAHGRSVGDSFIKWRGNITNQGGLPFKGRLFTVDTVDVNSFTFEHPDGTANATENDGGSDTFIWFPVAVNNHEAVFNDGLLANTRLDLAESGPIACTWIMTQMMKDSVTTSLSNTMSLRWLITAYNDGTDTINGNLEYLAMPLNATRNVAGIAEWNYTAKLQDDITVKETYTEVAHMARSSWATVRMDNDDQHGKSHWLVPSQMPTLIAVHDAEYMENAFIVPPFPLIGASIPANDVATYVPSDNLGFRDDTDASGGYNGRTPLNEEDTTCLLKGDAQSWRAARVNAYHAAHFPCVLREPASDTCISYILRPKASEEYNFEADGMEAPTDDYWGGRVTAVSSEGTWDNDTAGMNNGSHQVSPAFGQWLLTGELVFLEMLMNTAMKSAHNTGFNRNLINEPIASRASAWSIPSTQWSGIVAGRSLANWRYIGWQSLAIGHCAGTIPDAHPQGNYWRKVNEHQGDMFQASYDVLPQVWKDVGMFISVDNSSKSGHRYFFDLMNGVSFAYVHMLTEDPGYDTMANAFARYVKAKFQMNHSAMGRYNSCERVDPEDLNPSTSPPHTPANMFADIQDDCYVIGNDDDLYIKSPNNKNWEADDKIIAMSYNGEQNSRVVLIELPVATEKHIISSTGTFVVKLSDTQGGGAIDLPTQSFPAITSITQADPVVITFASDPGIADNKEFTIENILGMTELNTSIANEDEWWRANNPSAGAPWTIEVQYKPGSSWTNLDGTGFTAYTSGGDIATERLCFQVQWAGENTSGTNPSPGGYAVMAAMLMRMRHNGGDADLDDALMTELNTYISAEDYTAGGNDLQYASRDLT